MKKKNGIASRLFEIFIFLSSMLLFLSLLFFPLTKKEVAQYMKASLLIGT